MKQNRSRVVMIYLSSTLLVILIDIDFGKEKNGHYWFFTWLLSYFIGGAESLVTHISYEGQMHIREE